MTGFQLKSGSFMVDQRGSSADSVFSFTLFLVFYESGFGQGKVLGGCSGGGCLAKATD